MMNDVSVKMYKSAASALPAAPASSSSISKVPKPTQDELDDLYRQLESIGRRSVMLSILPGCCHKFAPECEVGTLPPTLPSLFNEEFLELSHLELLNKCEESYNSYRTAGKAS